MLGKIAGTSQMSVHKFLDTENWALQLDIFLGQSN